MIAETTNNLFSAHFDNSMNSFICRFVDFGIKSCFIMYGVLNPLDQNCNINYETSNTSDNDTHLDAMTVSITTLELNSDFCFIAIGKSENFTIAIRGNFSVSGN